MTITLEYEDKLFAEAYGLSQGELVSLFGGLTAYRMLCEDRKRARLLGYLVPSLPLPTSAEIKLSQRMDSNTTTILKNAVQDHRKRVAGALSALSLDEKMASYRRDQREQERIVSDARESYRTERLSPAEHDRIIHSQG